jgi:hypothetical protein
MVDREVTAETEGTDSWEEVGGQSGQAYFMVDPAVRPMEELEELRGWQVRVARSHR